MISSLLIANRGEIACRIMRTCRALGIRTVAVYSDADVHAKHVREADEAVWIGASPAPESYLDIERIIEAAHVSEVDAIHPGYGFLSENADFAQMTADAGMIFVGPPPSAIEAMGLKDRAKQIMEEAGVPVVPGFQGDNQSADFLKRKAYEIGYPVLIKAVAGGGGKGMRKVDKAIGFDDALDAAKREALAAFGNDKVLIEKFIQSPRHIEIQVFGDGKGNAVHLFERDCSLQRRHQKVIEEAPAPGMTTAVRKAMGKAACDAARAVGYQGAGTVEFIVDAADGLKEDGFWFMEMNTRLQVEHPVTEMITGIDLVEWQLRVASGEKLPLEQEKIELSGHAVEARIYAEDPKSGFLPSTGKLIALEFPGASDSVRIDSGVEQGDDITPHYDPMIAKLIIHQPTRRRAMESLSSALSETTIAGPETNVGFLKGLCENKSFLAENFDTGLIDREIDNLIPSDNVTPEMIASGVLALETARSGRIATSDDANSPWRAADGFQLSGGREVSRTLLVNGGEHVVRVRSDGKRAQVLVGEDWVDEAQARSFIDDGSVWVVADGRQSRLQEIDYASGSAGQSDSDGAVLVPMHGKVIALTVSEGETVEKGDMLFSVEAMKMEHAVLAPFDGVVSEVNIDVDAQIDAGTVAVVMQADDA